MDQRLYPTVASAQDAAGSNDGLSEWGAKAQKKRQTARNAARRHSFLVRFLRYALPIAGVMIVFAIVAVVVVTSYLSSLGFGPVTLTSEGLVMDRPELSGNDGDRSYKVSATRAIQRISDPRIIDLETLTAAISLGQGQSAQITSTRGTFDTGAETLKLMGGIEVSYSQGFLGHFEQMDIDLKTGQIITKDPVTIQSEHGRIRAGDMQFDQKSGTLVFSDGISMRLEPAHKESDK